MIFVDTNVLMYAVGRPHPLQGEARAFFSECVARRLPLATSAEVLQELLHAYLPVQRFGALDDALTLVRSFIPSVWSLEAEDVYFAHLLAKRYPKLGARDLLHLASCRRRSVTELKTFDRSLRSASVAGLRAP